MILIILVFSPIALVAEETTKKQQAVTHENAVRPQPTTQELLATCATCHGEKGQSESSSFPNLSGQHQSYLLKQLHEFRKGEHGLRNNPVMYGFVSELSDQQLENLASFFSSQKGMLMETTERSDLVFASRIYKGGILSQKVMACAACHGPAGQGNAPALIPKLWGQHADYIQATLLDYKNGVRHHPMMNSIAAKLTESQIEALAHYIQGIQPK